MYSLEGFDVLQVVLMEAPLDVFDQLGRRMQVDLCGLDVHVAHVGSQPRQAGVDIRAVPVPGQKPVNREGVTQVVEAWSSGRVVRNSAALQQASEGWIDGRLMQRAAALVEEERRVQRAGLPAQASVHLLPHRPARRLAQRHPAGLAELARGDVEPLLGAVEVLQRQRARLADPDPRAVQQPQQGAVSLRP